MFVDKHKVSLRIIQSLYWSTHNINCQIFISWLYEKERKKDILTSSKAKIWPMRHWCTIK